MARRRRDGPSKGIKHPSSGPRKGMPFVGPCERQPRLNDCPAWVKRTTRGVIESDVSVRPPSADSCLKARHVAT
eukprot:365968-Chlamydomonas_euryale.AAC.11